MKGESMTDKIPISTAAGIAHKHGYDQVIILARRVGDGGQEWVTTYGKDKANGDAAARIGDALRDNVTPTLTRLRAAVEAFIVETVDYMTRNNLGDPEGQHTVRQGRAALDGAEMRRKPKTNSVTGYP